MSDFDLRRAEPGQRFTYTEPDGGQRELRADDDGVVRPTSVADEEYLNTLSLPVARKAMREEKADASAAEG